MSRRSTRLVSKEPSFPDDDAASTSSTGSTGHITYKESPTRIFKKRSGRKSTGSVSRNSSRASSVSQLLTGQRSEFTAAENENGMPFATQGFSSGYSSAEEHYEQSIKSNPSSAQSVAEPQFVVWDVFHSPAQALVMFYWWLGSSWYSLTSRLSLINVFLLSRYSKISNLKSSISNLQSAQDLVKERVDAQDTLNIKLRAELSDWLIKLLKDPSSLESTIVLRPELQRALEDLEKGILDKLVHEKESRRDVWRTVGETLQQEGAGAVTIQDVKEIIHRAVSLYRADGIGLADYALESSGASVLNTRCSETYKTRSACLSLFGIPLWYHSESPRTVIQPELYPGKCWAFRGSQGFLVISLSYPVRITHVTLEHLPKELSPTGRIDSAPKDFAVYGMSDETEDGKLLGTFTYDQDGEPIQTFKLAEASEIYSMTELRILSNWGHLEYTCVYRFRVHGEPSFV
ncbi:LOW QUALITY PROTEIN: SUN domain-containing protein 2-like [Sinocyclocheilus grahami]|uniref:LOW QUALITY PROTEIN: SUN domain-containing protein 2-like n=1 Tax=Sinocyclocheilus grahami TaxID=75366 RepID=UPI0007AC60E0|nr:PREDICTED: LOW QUALITY PROTEIN: SUN domain-containing protein 2-like [Sinocyclocheilus grahami]